MGLQPPLKEKTTYLRSPPTPGKAPKQKAKQAKKKNLKKTKQKAPKQLSNQLLYTEIDKYYKSIAIYF